MTTLGLILIGAAGRVGSAGDAAETAFAVNRDGAAHVTQACAKVGSPASLIEAIPSREWPTHATRPAYSMLDITSFETAYGCRPGDWHTGLFEVIERLRADRRDVTATHC